MKKITTLALLAFSALTLSAQTATQAFTSSGTFTVPAGVTTISIEVVGAGGTGGGNGGGGGGGGGYASGTYTVTPLSTLPVIVGTGSNGPTIGTSSVSTFISATGGDNGTSVSNPNIGGGGVGGTGTGGSINYTGGTGGGGYWTYFGGGGGGAAGSAGNGTNGGNTIAWTGICQTPGGAGGASGGAPGGAGGKGAGFTDANCNVTDPSVAGANYGGGGGGANGNGGAAAAGADGYVIISWLTTGINTHFVNEDLVISPNPFTHTINVQHASGDETFELVNAFGQMIWSGKNIERNDFSDLPNGVYFLKVTSQETVRIRKLIKE
jgi:hypothetical protein